MDWLAGSVLQGEEWICIACTFPWAAGYLYPIAIRIRIGLSSGVLIVEPDPSTE
jgi:hypothetical protein